MKHCLKGWAITLIGRRLDYFDLIDLKEWANVYVIVFKPMERAQQFIGVKRRFYIHELGGEQTWVLKIELFDHCEIYEWIEPDGKELRCTNDECAVTTCCLDCGKYRERFCLGCTIAYDYLDARHEVMKKCKYVKVVEKIRLRCRDGKP